MKISEPMNVMQERASARASFARRFGCACLILMALASRQVMAADLPAVDVIPVTLQPGETTKTIQVPRGADVSVNYVTPEHLCNWPTTAHIKTSLEMAASSGRLPQMLTQIENAGSASGTAIAQALGVIEQFGGWPAYDGLFVGRNQVFTQQQLASGTLTYTYVNRCLNVDEARAGIMEIRRIIRSYLGMTAPTADSVNPGLLPGQTLEFKAQPLAVPAPTR